MFRISSRKLSYPPIEVRNSPTQDIPEKKGFATIWIRERLLKLAGLTCLLAGGIGILRAPELDRAIDTVICLGCSVAVCGWVVYLWFLEP